MKQIGKILFLFVCVICAAGCSSIQMTGNNSAERHVKINRDQAVYIIVADDGQHEDKVYFGSGRAVTKIIFKECARQFKLAETSVFVDSLEGGLAQARKQGVAYLIYPEIVDWQYNGDIFIWTPEITKRAEIKISLFDTATGNLLDSVTIKAHGASPWIATNVREPLEKLLSDPIRKYIQSL